MRIGYVDQPSDAVNQLLHGKGFDQALHAGLIQEGADFGIIAKAGDENEATPEFRAHLSGLVVEIVPPQMRHQDVTNDRIVPVGGDLQHRFVTIVGNVYEEVFVSQNPLESFRQLVIIVHQEDRFEFVNVRVRSHQIRLFYEFHNYRGEQRNVPLQRFSGRQAFLRACPSRGG
jgi:hypothetical protein